MNTGSFNEKPEQKSCTKSKTETVAVSKGSCLARAIELCTVSCVNAKLSKKPGESSAGSTGCSLVEGIGGF